MGRGTEALTDRPQGTTGVPLPGFLPVGFPVRLLLSLFIFSQT